MRHHYMFHFPKLGTGHLGVLRFTVRDNVPREMASEFLGISPKTSRIGFSVFSEKHI